MAAREVIEVTPAADEARAVATITMAFGSDPAERWLFPDANQYLTFWPPFVRAFAGEAFVNVPQSSDHRYGPAGPFVEQQAARSGRHHARAHGRLHGEAHAREGPYRVAPSTAVVELLCLVTHSVIPGVNNCAGGVVVQPREASFQLIDHLMRRRHGKFGLATWLCSPRGVATECSRSRDTASVTLVWSWGRSAEVPAAGEGPHATAMSTAGR